MQLGHCQNQMSNQQAYVSAKKPGSLQLGMSSQWYPLSQGDDNIVMESFPEELPPTSGTQRIKIFLRRVGRMTPQSLPSIPAVFLLSLLELTLPPTLIGRSECKVINKDAVSCLSLHTHQKLPSSFCCLRAVDWMSVYIMLPSEKMNRVPTMCYTQKQTGLTTGPSGTYTLSQPQHKEIDSSSLTNIKYAPQTSRNESNIFNVNLLFNKRKAHL